ncbi:MAG: ribbon-helix-helix protein, CopG family [Spirochaetaceae bacterium]|nr:MAG: ribbon-helix-helix protein, CopG family [Spirochaetaceae bacterium]
MAHDTTLHIKIDSATNEELTRLAAARGTSKGRLVRDAISACYHVPIDELPVQQRRALAAFEGGFISIGKLAESLGLHVLEMRRWLSEHGIDQGTGTSADDHRHA